MDLQAFDCNCLLPNIYYSIILFMIVFAFTLNTHMPVYKNIACTHKSRHCSD